MDLASIARKALQKAASETAFPAAFGNHTAGMMDPSPNKARYTMISEMRSAGNRQNYLDDQVQGTNITQYAEGLDPRFSGISQGIMAGMNQVALPYQGGVKTASMEDQWLQKMASTGLFKEVVPADEETYAAIVSSALEKTASELVPTLIQMYNSGLIPQEIANQIVIE